MITERIKKNFERDIAQHQMRIFKEDGVHRHIRFNRPGTSMMHFDLITWPGYLCYTGDMGTFVFQRVEDMFDFFRRPDKSYRIDLGYWAEKVEACDKSGIKRFSKEVLSAELEQWISGSEKNDRPDEDEAQQLALHQAAYAELRAAVACDILTCDDNEVRAYDAVNSFEHQGDAWEAAFGDSACYTFGDFWEVDTTEYTHRFLWCCQALAWAIALYDKTLLEQTAPTVPA